MSGEGTHERLLALEERLGDERRTLLVGDRRIGLEGLDRGLAGDLDRRWGGFLEREGAADVTLRVYRSRSGGWLDPWKPGEQYRIEPLDRSVARVIASYNFALCADPEPGGWRVAVHVQESEPTERLFENAVRYLVARLGVEAGGFALHAAGVLHRERAWLFAGPSRAGKSTAVGLAAPAVSLGDDFALVLPGDGEWRVPALPFDNSERARPDPPRGTFPLAGIWRLHKSEVTRAEQPLGQLALASLMSCLAFPWALPEFSEALLDHSQRYLDQGRFRDLHFSREADLWPVLLDERSGE